MPLPPTVRVKLSSEAAGGISITPVVVQDLPTRELIEHMLSLTGKDEPRIREILRRGALVSGASRFRWSGWDAEEDDVREILAAFPDPDPALPFAAGRCVRAILRGSRQAIDLPREAAARKAGFERHDFWEILMDMAVSGAIVYGGYSYRERADRYVRDLSAGEMERLRAASAAIRYSTLREQIRAAVLTRVELYTLRDPDKGAGGKAEPHHDER